jgi:hypothetical protein
MLRPLRPREFSRIQRIASDAPAVLPSDLVGRAAHAGALQPRGTLRSACSKTARVSFVRSPTWSSAR